jgi:hypothetical protein
MWPLLGEIMDLSAPEAAEALDLDPAAFRKRLQRAREAVETFTRPIAALCPKQPIASAIAAF